MIFWCTNAANQVVPLERPTLRQSPILRHRSVKSEVSILNDRLKVVTIAALAISSTVATVFNSTKNFSRSIPSTLEASKSAYKVSDSTSSEAVESYKVRIGKIASVCFSDFESYAFNFNNSTADEVSEYIDFLRDCIKLYEGSQRLQPLNISTITENKAL